MAANAPDPDRWITRSRNVTVFWQAIRAPLCWVLGFFLTTFLSIAWFLGHDPAPYLVVIDGGLLGLPFFFVSQHGGGSGQQP